MKNNIYIVLHTLSTGGAERHASSIANFLSKNDYNVTIVLLDNNIVVYDLAENIKVCALPEQAYPDDIESQQARLKDRLLLKTFALISSKKHDDYNRLLYYKLHYVNKLHCFFEKHSIERSDMVISFMPVPNLCCSMLQKDFGFKLILGEFNSPHLEYPKDAIENRLKRKYFPNASGFVFQTEEQESFYTYLPDVKKEIIPNPIEKIVTQPYQGERKKQIVNFCRLSIAKNLPLLLDSFAKLYNEYPDYSLVIYGEGSEKRLLEEMIKENNLVESVLILPFANNVLDLVRDSAMFVSSSDREGISNSMLEAMAIGLPVICTDCPAGGARMMINPYENGILVPVRDPEAMYQAMKYMIEHPDKAEEMGRKAVEVRQKLEKNKILRQWLSFIESI